MATYYFCLNQVSYLVASEHAAAWPDGDSVIYVDVRRVRVQQRYQPQRWRPISRLGTLAALLRSLAQRPEAVYIPHHRTGNLIQSLASRARRVGLVDDGMDTLRDKPSNIDPVRIRPRATLLTFSDYRRTGAWTTGLTIAPVCRLEMLADGEEAGFDMSGVSTVVVESPGVLARPNTPHGGQVVGRDVLYVLHPSPIKRQLQPGAAAVFPSAQCSVEKSLLDFHGSVVVGETMVLPFLLHCADLTKTTVEVQLNREQYANLAPMHELLSDPRVRLTVHS